MCDALYFDQKFRNVHRGLLGCDICRIVDGTDDSAIHTASVFRDEVGGSMFLETLANPNCVTIRRPQRRQDPEFEAQPQLTRIFKKNLLTPLCLFLEQLLGILP